MLDWADVIRRITVGLREDVVASRSSFYRYPEVVALAPPSSGGYSASASASGAAGRVVDGVKSRSSERENLTNTRGRVSLGAPAFQGTTPRTPYSGLHWY
jgi:hypothetical protein